MLLLHRLPVAVTTGGWKLGGSVYATALAVSAIKRFSFHNWAVRSLIAEPQEPRDGERVKLNIVVENDSNMASPPTGTYCRN